MKKPNIDDYREDDDFPRQYIKDDEVWREENAVHCRGKNCDKTTFNDNTVEQRYDAYGISTGYYCDHCYEHNYPYRKDRYFDPGYAGERMDDDY